MSNIKNLVRAECTVETARGLMQVAHFLFDHAEGDDWQQLRTPFGCLMNMISAELGRVSSNVDQLYADHHAANQNRRAAL